MGTWTDRCEDARRTWKWTRLFGCEDQAWLWGAETEVGGNDQDDSSNDDEMRVCTITGKGMQRAPQSSNAKYRNQLESGESDLGDGQ
jgi:hypothetical protein